MQTISLALVESLLDGHVGIRRRPGALQPLRLPVDELSFYDPYTRWVASATAGVRLRFVSDTRALRLTTQQRLAASANEGEMRPCAYDLFVGGERLARKAAQGGAVLTPDGGLIGDERAVIGFEELKPGPKSIELWLPQSATVSVLALEIDDGASIAAWPDLRPRLVFHGSSISHCMEADGPSGSWPAVASALADARLLNLGWAGSCLLSAQAARIIRDQPAAAIVLKLGINVWADGMLRDRAFLDSAHAMISIIRERHATTPLVIVSPIYSPGREDAGSNGGPSLARMRAMLEHIVAARIKAGDGDIGYLSGLDLFGEADVADLPDNLLPNAAGYARMGERFFARMLAPATGAWAAHLNLGA